MLVYSSVFAGCVFLLGGILLAVFARTVEWNTEPAWLMMKIGACFLFLIAPLVIGAVVVHLYLNNVRLKRATPDKIILTQVAPEFIEALRFHRASNSQLPESSAAQAVFSTADLLRVFPLTENASRVLEQANHRAQTNGQDYVGTEHVLDSLGPDWFQHLNIEADSLKELMDENKLTPSPTPHRRRLAITPALRKALEFAHEEARQQGLSTIDSKLLLLGLLRVPEGIVGQLLQCQGHSLEGLLNKVRWNP
jgi:hypothetical protein